MENHFHNLETGDQVTFREVVGMAALNGTTHTIIGTEKAQHTVRGTESRNGCPQWPLMHNTGTEDRNGYSQWYHIHC